MSIAAHHLTCRQSGKTLVEDVSVEFRDARISAIVGPNGAGKTTLLRLLGGELKPESGSIRYNGCDSTQMRLDALARVRAVMTQNSHIVFDFTVEDVLMMGWVRGADRLLKPQLQSVVEQCRIQDLLVRRFNSLSGGEQQRVQFARALLQVCPLLETGHARFLLLDEPTASLDVAHELLVLRLCRQAAAANIGVVVVLHDLNLASRFADEVFLMREGELIANGEPADVLQGDLLSDVYGTPMRVERHAGLHRLMVYT